MRYDLLLVCIGGWGLAIFLMKVAGSNLSPPAVILTNVTGYLLTLPFLVRFLTETDRPIRGAHLIGIGVGILFVTANFAFYSLIRGGAIARFAPLTSLYVAVPVVLGATLLRERLTVAQWAGVGCALLAGYLLALEPPPAETTALTAPQPPVTGEPARPPAAPPAEEGP